MQNKGFVKIFAVLLTLVCLFYLSFTFITSREDKKVEDWANTQTESWVAQLEADSIAVSESDKAEFFKDKKNDRAFGMNIYATVQNVATITAYEGLDPEVFSGIDNNLYPRPRTYIVGVKFNF